MKSEKLLHISIKLLNSQILFCKFQTNLQIQELSLNPEKYFANPKKYFVTCYLRQQPTTVSGLPHPKWRSLVSRGRRRGSRGGEMGEFSPPFF